VSRHHLRLQGGVAGVRVVDDGSTNGTWYEGARVRDVVVPFVAGLVLGAARLRLAPVESELRPARGDHAADAARASFGGLVGGDPRMRELFAMLADVAPLDATVIIGGETGTGKELVARALHDASARAGRPFVVFDCTAVPKDLIESALFGHVKGAFTGATGSRQGAFRRAHGGTIFLDELGELPLELQPKLLRVLEGRTVQAVGGDDPERIDVRIVCATHRDLKAEVKAGRFREDLYYRLAVVKVHLPPLRERPDDIEPLVRHFVRQLRASEPALEGFDALRRYAFPGNVRELRNLVERAVSLSKGRVVDLAVHLPSDEAIAGPGQRAVGFADIDVATAIEDSVGELRAAAADALGGDHAFKDAKAIVVEAFERVFLAGVVRRAGNLSRAAQAAQMDRKHLRDLLRRHGLRVEGGADET
jgi:DNA-binding NtrC family response regulator